MNANELAKYMRERALLIEGDESLTEQSLRKFAQVATAKKQKLDRIEELKKLYFNAGRWVGGARDYTAREAFQAYQARERLTQHRVK